MLRRGVPVQSDGSERVSLAAIILLVVGVWLAIKVVDALLKLAFWGVALVGAYWFLAPLMDWPWPF